MVYTRDGILLSPDKAAPCPCMGDIEDNAKGKKSLNSNPLHPSSKARHGQGSMVNWRDGPAIKDTCSFCFCFFETRFLCSFGACPGTHSVDQAGLELTEIRLPPPPEYWD